MLIAAVQMISGPAVDANLREAERLIDLAVAQGAQLVALPEYFPLIGASDAERLAARETLADAEDGGDNSGPIQAFLADTARRHGIWLVGGSLPLVADDPAKLRNACLVYDNVGRRVAHYDKIHLFGFTHGTESYDESLTIEPGSTAVGFDTPTLDEIRRIGLAICYDLRFPELFRAMGEVDLLVVPAAFTEITGCAHWEMLLRARAVENLACVIAPAQGGRHENGRRTWGHSLIVDPWGRVQAQCTEGEAVLTAELDPRHLAQCRALLPALAHRRL